MWKKENLRKNFLRVKQMADQNLGRAEKSEVLTEDQQGNEKRVETVRQVSHNLIKKVAALLEAPPGTDPDKRLKKLPETSLAHALLESSGLLGTDTLLGNICQQVGDCQNQLAKEELECELEIEKEVLTPLQTVADVDIPSIQKHRKHLNKSTLDMDSAKNRFNSAVRQSHTPGANMASAAAKADAVRDEYDEACNKVEAIKDNLSIELCNFIAKESEHSSRLIALLESQAAYHRRSLKAIEAMIPKMKETIESSPAKPLFGMCLEEHLGTMGRDVSLVLEACILTLLDTGLDEEGLFRIAGSALKLKKLRACFDAHALDMEEFSTDPHTVAGVLKQYLRELPEPLMTFDLCAEFMHATQIPQDKRLKTLQATVNKLPPSNYNNLRYLVKFLAVLAEKSQINKMTPSNIAIVMGPNLLWARGETAPNMMTAGAVSAIIESFIINADFFFPGELDFHLTGLGCAPPSPSILNLSGDEPPKLTVSDVKDQTDATPPPTEAGPELGTVAKWSGDATLVEMAAGEAMLLMSAPPSRQPQQDAGDGSSESSGEVVVLGGLGPGEKTRQISSPPCGDGLLHTSAPSSTTTTTTLPSTNLRSSTVASLLGRPPVSPSGGVASSSSRPGFLSMGPALSMPHLSSAATTSLPPTSPSQSVHSDMYSTLFALHSLGEGGEEACSDYRTRVRALWDGQFQPVTLPPPPSSEKGGRGARAATLKSSRSEDVLDTLPSGGQQSPSSSSSPPLSVAPSGPPGETEASEGGGKAATVGSTEECQGSCHPKAEEGSQEIDFDSVSYSPESPAQEYRQENIMTMSSPSVFTHSPAASNRSSPIPNSPASEGLSPNIAADSPEGPQLSPKIQRRVTKKPAPPPPPDRSYNVAVTASVSKATTGNGGVASQTWPRNVPLNSSSEAPSDPGGDGGEKRLSPPERRTSGHDRPHGPPPERPSGPPPERPKAPPALQSGDQQASSGGGGGHQRSSSTGAMYITTTAGPNPEDSTNGDRLLSIPPLLSSTARE